MAQPPISRGPRRRLAPIPYVLLFVALVAAASTFVWRDFHSSVAVAVEAIERDTGLVAELSTRSDGSVDSGPVAAFAPRHLERMSGRVELMDASGRVVYQAGRAPDGPAEPSVTQGARLFDAPDGAAWLEVTRPLGDEAAVLITTPYEDLQDRVLAEARGRYAGFGSAALLVVLTMLLVVEFFLRRSSRLQQLVTQSRHWALHDELTGLPNRALFRDRALQSLGQARRHSSGIAMMIMDLDRFKEVNDTLGHHHGDLLLKEVSQRLTSALREVDTVARFGGDEFAVLLTDADDDAAIHKVVAKILEAVRRPLVLDGFTISIDASIGIAVSPRHGNDFETLMKRADVAMYQAKAVGGGFELYSASRDDNSAGKLTLTHDLKSAIDNDQLVLHYQPQMDLPGRRVEMVEALVRWQHPARGLLAPQEFIRLAEKSGLIRDLSRWVIENALHQNSFWRSQGLDVGVAVNVSARDLLDPSFGTEIQQLLRRYSVPPSALELEITESALMAGPDRAAAILEQLRGLGVKLSIDDFGTGYSSLAYLQRLPVTGVKIDKSFVKGLRRGDAGFVIVRSTIEIARVLGLRTVAEGVEDEALWDTLAALGCDAAQGHWVAHPIVGEQIPWLLSVLRGPARGEDELEQLLLGPD
ncbi:hypothetical protein BH18ACT16_BH18ACT16_14520 [soil metagenome]